MKCVGPDDLTIELYHTFKRQVTPIYTVFSRTWKRRDNFLISFITKYYYDKKNQRQFKNKKPETNIPHEYKHKNT